VDRTANSNNAGQMNFGFTTGLNVQSVQWQPSKKVTASDLPDSDPRKAILSDLEDLMCGPVSAQYPMDDEDELKLSPLRIIEQ
jgi:hypothetical protein